MEPHDQGPGVAHPLVSVVICTRNRAEDASTAVRSILESEGVDLDLILVDQSDGGETREALADLAAVPGFRRVPTETRGLGAGLDLGLRLARSPYVVHTDDDCTVPPDWVAGMAQILSDNDDVALVFCDVIAAPYDERDGYVPVHLGGSKRVLRRPISVWRGGGIGAGMAFRRDAVLAAGGIDHLMGAGSRFPSSEEFDVELRMLLRGWKVLITPDLQVIHHGFRTFAEGKEHMVRDWFGFGACLGKFARAGQPIAVVLALTTVVTRVVMPMVSDLAGLRRPRGFRRILVFGRGFAAGIATPADARSLTFCS